MEKVQAGNFCFPTFFERCPICHGKDCAVRIGYYYRWVIELQINKQAIIFLYIPIARYLCRKKNKQRINHLTFSLLPDSLIPYNCISIDLLIYILQLLIEEDHPTSQALKKIDAMSPDACMISEKTIMHLFNLFEQTRIKLILFFQIYKNKNRAPPDFSSYTTKEIFNFLMKYTPPDTESLHCTAYFLSQQYYNQCGSYSKNAHFLFGTASQFCKQG